MLFFISIFLNDLIKCSKDTKEKELLPIHYIPHIQHNCIPADHTQQTSKNEDTEKKRKQERLNGIINLIAKRKKLKNDNPESANELSYRSFSENIPSDKYLTEECNSYQLAPIDLRKKSETGISINTMAYIHHKNIPVLSICKSKRKNERTRVIRKSNYCSEENSDEILAASNSYKAEERIDSSNPKTDEPENQDATEFNFKNYILERLDNLKLLSHSDSIYDSDDNLRNFINIIQNFIDNITEFINIIGEKTSNEIYIDNTNPILSIDNIFLQMENEKQFIKTSFSADNPNDIKRIFSFALRLIEFEKNNKKHFQDGLLSFFVEKAGFIDFLDKFKNCPKISFLHELRVLKNIYNAGFMQKTRDGYILYTLFLFEAFFTHMETIFSNLENIEKIKNKSNRTPYKRTPGIFYCYYQILFLKTILMRIIYGFKDGFHIAKKYVSILLIDFNEIFTNFYSKSFDYELNIRIKINILYTNILCSIIPDETLKVFTDRLSDVLYFNEPNEFIFLELSNFKINGILETILKYFEFIDKLHEEILSINHPIQSKTILRNKYNRIYNAFRQNDFYLNPKTEMITLYFLDFYHCYLRKLLYSNYQFEIYISKSTWLDRLNLFEDIMLVKK